MVPIAAGSITRVPLHLLILALTIASRITIALRIAVAFLFAISIARAIGVGVAVAAGVAVRIAATVTIAVVRMMPGTWRRIVAAAGADGRRS